MQTTDGKMKGAAVIAWFCLVGGPSAPSSGQNTAGNFAVSYRGNQLWKINDQNGAAVELLDRLERKNYLSLWGKTATTVDAMIDARHLEDVRAALTANNLIYEVSLDDVQRAIEEENPEPPALDERRGHRLTWVHYHRLEDIYGYLHHTETAFPELCSLHTVGHSVEGRPVKLLKVSNGRANNRAIFIEGGAHAREWISPAAVTYFINELVYDYENQPKSVRYFDWYFVPVLNPDGYEYSHTTDRLWRKNKANFDRCTGVDLNRNWDFSWNRNGSNIDPCSNQYRGPRPFSEPETAAVARFFSNNRHIDWKAFVSVHNYGQYIVYPWGTLGEALEDREELDEIGRRAAVAIFDAGGELYTVGPIASTIYTTTGNSIDWARGVRGIKYAYTIELRDRGHHGFILPVSFIKPTSVEALIFIRTLAEAAAGA